jgi:hypothetical protein
VALDAAGNALAVWARFNGSHFVIQAAARPADDEWQTPKNISAAQRESDSPQVALDPAGNAIAVWASVNGGHWVVQAAARSAGGAWEAPQDLSNADEDAGSAEAALDAAGNAIAVWASWNGRRSVVQAAARPARGPWQAPRDMSNAGESAGSPHVAFDAAGNAIAVWTSLRGSHSVVQAARRPGDGAWQPLQDISGAGLNVLAPQLALNPAGDALAVWFRSDSRLVVQAASRPAGGAWQTPQDISAPGYNWRDEVALQVALDPAGNALAVWHQFDGLHFFVQAAARPAGGAWETVQDLSAAGQSAGYPQLALDAAGNALAVWQRSNGSNFIIQAAARRAGGAWETPQDLSAAGQNASASQVAMDREGNALAVWARSNGQNYIVQASQNSDKRMASSPRCLVPKVVGKTLARAKAALKKNQCRLGRLRRSYSPRVKKGRVVSQSVRPGRKLRNGTRVNLVVSRGRR